MEQLQIVRIVESKYGEINQCVDPRIIRAIIIRLNCKSLECSEEKIKKQKNDQALRWPWYGRSGEAPGGFSTPAIPRL